MSPLIKKGPNNKKKACNAFLHSMHEREVTWVRESGLIEVGRLKEIWAAAAAPTVEVEDMVVAVCTPGGTRPACLRCRRPGNLPRLFLVPFFYLCKPPSYACAMLRHMARCCF